VKLGRLTFGPKVSTSYRTQGGMTLAPYVGLKGIWDFETAEQVDLTTGLAATGNDSLRGRTEAGLSITLPDGKSLTGEGFYDGLGADSYEPYGGSIRVRYRSTV